MAGFWRGLSFWLADGHLLTVCSHDLSSVCVRGEREQSFLLSLLVRTLILSDQGPTLMTSFNLNYFLEGPFLNTAIWGLGLQHMNLGRGTNIQSINGRIRSSLRDRKSSGHFEEGLFSPAVAWGGFGSQVQGGMGSALLTCDWPHSDIPVCMAKIGPLEFRMLPSVLLLFSCPQEVAWGLSDTRTLTRSTGPPFTPGDATQSTHLPHHLLCGEDAMPSLGSQIQSTFKYHFLGQTP